MFCAFVRQLPSIRAFLTNIASMPPERSVPKPHSDGDFAFVTETNADVPARWRSIRKKHLRGFGGRHTNMYLHKLCKTNSFLANDATIRILSREESENDGPDVQRLHLNGFCQHRPNWFLVCQRCHRSARFFARNPKMMVPMQRKCILAKKAEIA